MGDGEMRKCLILTGKRKLQNELELGRKCIDMQVKCGGAHRALLAVKGV